MTEKDKELYAVPGVDVTSSHLGLQEKQTMDFITDAIVEAVKQATPGVGPAARFGLLVVALGDIGREAADAGMRREVRESLLAKLVASGGCSVRKRAAAGVC